jgi:hypothetical protein
MLESFLGLDSLAEAGALSGDLEKTAGTCKKIRDSETLMKKNPLF